jgi:hypothetical protein
MGWGAMKSVPGGRSLAILGVVWATVLTIHVVLRLGDILLWIGFPVLFLPWVLFGPKNWFDP